MLLHRHAFAELDVDPASPVREKTKAGERGDCRIRSRSRFPFGAPALLRFLGVGGPRDFCPREKPSRPSQGWQTAGRAPEPELAWCSERTAARTRRQRRASSSTREVGDPRIASRKLDHALTASGKYPEVLLRRGAVAGLHDHVPANGRPEVVPPLTCLGRKAEDLPPKSLAICASAGLRADSGILSAFGGDHDDGKVWASHHFLLGFHELDELALFGFRHHVAHRR